MRAERLHSFLKALRNDFQRTGFPAAFAELTAAYEQLASSPSDPGYQQRVSVARTQLEAILNEPMKVDERGWRDAARELGISDLLGTELRDNLAAIFDREELTPSAIAPELQPIANRISELNTSVEAGLEVLNALHVSEEELAPGEWEIEIAIPRGWVDEELERLGGELEELDRILGPFVELADGSRPPIVVTSISSSDFTVFVAAMSPVALAFAKAINLLADSYLKIQQGRVAAQTLREMKLKETTLKEITGLVDDYMGTRAREIAEEVVSEFAEGLDEHRRNEIANEMTGSLKRLAPRLEHGFHFDVHFGELPPPEGADADDPEAARIAAENQRARETIGDARRAIKQIDLEGDPILSLPPPLEGEDAETDPSPKSGGEE
jgi:hypothetical protein